MKSLGPTPLVTQAPENIQCFLFFDITSVNISVSWEMTFNV